MKSLVVVYLPYVLSAISVFQIILAGDKSPRAWAVGLVNQVFWLVWILTSQTYGLLPMNLAIWVVYTRNHLKWKHDAAVSLSSKYKTTA